MVVSAVQCSGLRTSTNRRTEPRGETLAQWPNGFERQKGSNWFGGDESVAVLQTRYRNSHALEKGTT